VDTKILTGCNSIGDAVADIKLQKFSEIDFPFFKENSLASYSEDLSKASGRSKDNAKAMAEEQFKRLLPEGLNTKDNFLYSILNEDGLRIGHLWYSIREDFGVQRVFICDIYLDEKFRGNGFGTKALRWLEKEAKTLGISDILLHVFAHNDRAQKLYQSLGYYITNFHMAKKLT
jgi:ribosomal protein S18 acetylase RimI-like enzyme